MTVGVLITNFQSWPLTVRCVSEVLKWSGDRISQIVIVDDASDAPASWVGQGMVVLHHNTRNYGYAASVNIGVDLMRSDIVLLLDCDAYPLMDFEPTLVRRFSADGRLGALGATSKNAAGAETMTGEPKPALVGFLAGQALGDRLQKGGWVSSNGLVLHSYCMAVRTAAFRDIGGFDEKFDFLDADIDFSMRLIDAGWIITVDPTLKCYHKGSGSPQKTATRVRRFHRNRLLLLQKHGRTGWRFGVLVLLACRHAAELLILSVLTVLQKRNRGDIQNKRASRWELLRSVFSGYD